jgi:UBX domain-containing protein 1
MENPNQGVVDVDEEDQSNSNPNDNSTLINSFIEITSSTTQEANFFLESHNWDLDLAVSTFLDESAVAASEPSALPISTSPSASPASSPDYSPSSRSQTPSPSPSRAAYQLRPHRNTKKIKKKSKRQEISGRGGIRTLADLNQAPSSSQISNDEEEEEEDDDDDYEPEESAMMVQDSTEGNDVDQIFSQASRLAVERPSDDASSSARSFTGTARLLSGETLPSTTQEAANTNHTITFWRNGFTVDDGPLRRMDDPANASFLESIKKSECPRELEPSNRSTPVRVSLVRHEDNYRKPEKRKTPFQGVGRTLGNNSSADPANTEATVVSTILTSAPSPLVGLIVDTSVPTTSIQLRLADGTRMVSRFNFYHTISDIRAFIDASRPGGQRNYQLQMMGFPPKQLTDLNDTVEQAGIANSVVIQKF